MNRWRLLDLGLMNAYECNAMTDVLIAAKRKNLIPDTLLIRTAERHLQIGRSVSLKRINTQYCNKENIPIVRETTCDSLIIFDENTLMIDLISSMPPDSYFIERSMDCVVKSLQLMGLDTHKKPKSNDTMVGIKKVSGNSGRAFPDFTITNTGLILAFDHDIWEAAVPSAGTSARERMAGLRNLLGRDVSYDEAVLALKAGFEDTLQAEFEVTNSLTDAEEQLLEYFMVKYQSDEWLKYGKWSPVKEYWRLK